MLFADHTSVISTANSTEVPKSNADIAVEDNSKYCQNNGLKSK